jgi:hypothetical protein
VLQLYATQLDWMSRKLRISDQVFARVAVKSRTHAANNPYAAYRDPITIDVILSQPPLLRSLRPAYACRLGCGAASLLRCRQQGQRLLERHRAELVLAREERSVTDSDHDHPNVLDALGRDATRGGAPRLRTEVSALTISTASPRQRRSTLMQRALFDRPMESSASCSKAKTRTAERSSSALRAVCWRADTRSARPGWHRSLS